MAGLGLTETRKKLRERGQLPEDAIRTGQDAAARGEVGPDLGSQIAQQQIDQAMQGFGGNNPDFTPVVAEKDKDAVQALGAFDGLGGLINAYLGANVIDTGTRSVGLSDLESVAAGGGPTGEPVLGAEAAKNEIQDMGVVSGLGGIANITGGALGDFAGGAGDGGLGLAQTAVNTLADPGAAAANALNLGDTGAGGIARGALERSPQGVLGGLADVAYGIPGLQQVTQGAETGLGIAQGNFGGVDARQQERALEAGGTGQQTPGNLNLEDFRPGIPETIASTISNLVGLRSGQAWETPTDIAIARAMRAAEFEGQQIRNRREFQSEVRGAMELSSTLRLRATAAGSPEERISAVEAELKPIYDKYGPEFGDAIAQYSMSNPHAPGLSDTELMEADPVLKNIAAAGDYDGFKNRLAMKESRDLVNNFAARKSYGGPNGMGVRVQKLQDAANEFLPDEVAAATNDDGVVDLGEWQSIHDKLIDMGKYPDSSRIQTGEWLMWAKEPGLLYSQFNILTSDETLNRARERFSEELSNEFRAKRGAEGAAGGFIRFTTPDGRNVEVSLGDEGHVGGRTGREADRQRTQKLNDAWGLARIAADEIRPEFFQLDDRAKWWLGNIGENIGMGDLDPQDRSLLRQWNSYNSNIQRGVAMIAQTIDKGVLTNQDIQRAERIVPKYVPASDLITGKTSFSSEFAKNQAAMNFLAGAMVLQNEAAQNAGYQPRPIDSVLSEARSIMGETQRAAREQFVNGQALTELDAMPFIYDAIDQAIKDKYGPNMSASDFMDVDELLFYREAGVFGNGRTR